MLSEQILFFLVYVAGLTWLFVGFIAEPFHFYGDALLLAMLGILGGKIEVVIKRQKRDKCKI